MPTPGLLYEYHGAHSLLLRNRFVINYLLCLAPYVDAAVLPKGVRVPEAFLVSGSGRHPQSPSFRAEDLHEGQGLARQGQLVQGSKGRKNVGEGGCSRSTNPH